MTSEHEKWQKLKNNYLKQVEQALASIDHPKSADVLRDVDEHLERKFGELSPDNQNWEGCQQILIEMGPPQEYAELLAEEQTPAVKRIGLNEFLAVMFIVVLMVVGGYLIYTAKQTPLSDIAEKQPVVFSENLPVDGISIRQSHCTADFVQSRLGEPKRIDSNKRMLRYTDNGIDFWFSNNGPLSEVRLNRGFKGNLDTGISLHSSQKDVFKAYGKPIKKIDASNLHRKNDECVLYQKGDSSRIYYGNRGLIFWFKNDTILQIVVFKGKLIQQTSITKVVEFELDERVLGQWITVDFVQHIDDFDPAKKSWPGRLFLNSLTFKDNGKLVCSNDKVNAYTRLWTKGKTSPDRERPAFYYLRNLGGQTFLFYEWISGDVTLRGREPAYYVLKQVEDSETVVPSWFEEDRQAIGYWVSVDFVKSIEDFDPAQQQTTELYLKTLRFEDNGRLWWTIDNSQPIGLDWTKGKIRPFGAWPASYWVKQINQNDYLFYEYQTSQDPSSGYYVLKRTDTPEVVSEKRDAAFINDSHVLGQWKSVDFVEMIDQFQPDQTSWQGELFVKGLDFKEQGIVEWCLSEDRMKIDRQWTKGKLLDDDLPARYIIKTVDDGDYLFMEWTSGDVTIRGQKPWYYVLMKVTAPSEPGVIAYEPEPQKDIFGKWYAIDCVKSIGDFQPGQKQYKKPLILKELHFTAPQTVYWTFSNDVVKESSCTQKMVESVNGAAAKYVTRTIDGHEYLFIEWITPEVIKENKEAYYYVLLKSDSPLYTINRNRAEKTQQKITVGAYNCTADYIRSVLGAPTRIDYDDRMLRYTDKGLDFCFSQNGPLSEIHLNKGCTVQLETGTSLVSTKEQIFETYGEPYLKMNAADLHGKKDEGILYQKGNISRIYYGRHGLIFWFRDNTINQIVVFKGSLLLE